MLQFLCRLAYRLQSATNIGWLNPTGQLLVVRSEQNARTNQGTRRFRANCDPMGRGNGTVPAAHRSVPTSQGRVAATDTPSHCGDTGGNCPHRRNYIAVTRGHAGPEDRSRPAPLISAPAYDDHTHDRHQHRYARQQPSQEPVTEKDHKPGKNGNHYAPHQTATRPNAGMRPWGSEPH